MYNPKREYDEYCTRYLEKYCDIMYCKNGFSLKRYKDFKTQISGIDLTLGKEDKKYLVDEKSAIRYMNRTLNTFAFELSSKNNSSGYGWFLDPNVKTTHYSIIIPKSKTDNIEDLYLIKCLIIDKEKLKTCISNNRINLKEDIQKIVDLPKNEYGKSYIRYINGIKMVYSSNITPEEPINIVIPWELLRVISDFKFEYKIER